MKKSRKQPAGLKVLRQMPLKLGDVGDQRPSFISAPTRAPGTVGDGALAVCLLSRGTVGLPSGLTVSQPPRLLEGS